MQNSPQSNKKYEECKDDDHKCPFPLIDGHFKIIEQQYCSLYHPPILQAWGDLLQNPLEPVSCKRKTDYVKYADYEENQGM